MRCVSPSKERSWGLMVFASVILLVGTLPGLTGSQRIFRAVEAKTMQGESPSSESGRSSVSGEELVQAAIRDTADSGRELSATMEGSSPIDIEWIAPGRMPVESVRLVQGQMKFRASDLDTVIDDASH